MLTNTQPARFLLAALCIAITSASASAQFQWTGAIDNNYLLDNNWNPAIVPTQSDEIVFNSGSAVLIPTLNTIRAAATTLNNNSTLTFQPASSLYFWNQAVMTLNDTSTLVHDGSVGGNARFYNNSTINFNDASNFTLTGRLVSGFVGDSVINWDSTGTFDHSGNYFLIGQSQATGTINQTNGTVNANINDIDGGNMGFFLSDSNSGTGSQGIYNLTGGVLNIDVPSTTKTVTFRMGGSHNRADTSVNNGHDLFLVDGGTLNYTDVNTTTAQNARFRRSSKFQLDSGSVTMDTHSLYIGDGSFDPGDTAVLEINGGSMTVSTQIAMLLGQNGTNRGYFEMNDGTLDILTGDFWIGNEGSGDAVQNGGDITIVSSLIIDRGSTVQPDASTYTMYDGSLTLGDLTIGSNAHVNSGFFFEGGTLSITGDKTSLLNESWFNVAPGTLANYDSNANLTTFLIPEPTTAVLMLIGSLAMMRRRTTDRNA